MPGPFFVRDMNKHYKLLFIISILLPCDVFAAGSETSWNNAIPVAAFFGGIVVSLAIAKKIAQRPSVTTAINNRIAFPLYRRLQDEQDMELPEQELRERNRQEVEKSLTSLISRTQKRLAVIGAALAIAAGTNNQWWQRFANNVGWIQVRTSFGLSMLYYMIDPEGVAQPIFSSPIRESLWISVALLYTQFYDLQRNHTRMHQNDFPEYVLMVLSYLYELGRVDQ